MHRAHLYLLFTPSGCRGIAPLDTLRSALDGGVDAVQWRDPAGDAPRALLLDVHEICRRAGVPLLINDDPELAVRIGAAGAHVGQDDMPAARARSILGAERRLGVSTHDPAQVAAARVAGADHIGFGPCFATATKGYAHGLSDGEIQAGVAAAAAAELPLFAIGGITPENIDRLLRLGVSHIAVSAAILGAGDPAAAARALRARLPAR